MIKNYFSTEDVLFFPVIKLLFKINSKLIKIEICFIMQKKYIDFDVAITEQEIVKYLIHFHYSLIDVDGS